MTENLTILNILATEISSSVRGCHRQGRIGLLFLGTVILLDMAKSRSFVQKNHILFLLIKSFHFKIVQKC